MWEVASTAAGEAPPETLLVARELLSELEQASAGDGGAMGSHAAVRLRQDLSARSNRPNVTYSSPFEVGMLKRCSVKCRAGRPDSIPLVSKGECSRVGHASSRIDSVLAS